MSKNTENSNDLKITIDGITYNPAYSTGNTALQLPSMLGVQVEAGDVIGHSGKTKTDHNFVEHTHFEMIYMADDGGEQKTEFPTGVNFRYLNPEFYLNGLYQYAPY